MSWEARASLARQAVLVTLTLLALPVDAAGQRFEAGATVGRACAGSDGSLCGSDARLSVGTYAQVWVTEHIILRASADQLSRPTQTFAFGNVIDAISVPVQVRRARRSRTLLAVQAGYYFGGDTAVLRPFVSAGFGRSLDRSENTCTPPGCERVPQNLRGNAPLGKESNWYPTFVFEGGVAVFAWKALAIRGGLMFSNLAGDSLATSAAQLSVGYRFGRRP